MRISAISNMVGQGIILAVLSVGGLTALVGCAQEQSRSQSSRIIEMMDADGDGRISRSEWLKKPLAFNRIDKDADGYATAEELREFLQNRSSRGGGLGKRPGAGGGRFGTRPGMAGPGGERNRMGSATPPAASTTAPIDIIDTHVHLGFGPRERDFETGMAEALSRMPQRHVALAILIPTPQLGSNDNKYDYEELRRVARSSQFRVAGGSGLLGKYLYSSGKSVSQADKEAFRALATSLVEHGIVAFGEIGLYHFGNPKAGNVFGSVPLNHPLLEVLGDVAAKSGVPIDVHFEVLTRSINLPRLLQGAGNPSHLEANLPQFDRFLSRVRRAKIIWAHAGFEALPFRTAQLCERLLRRHENLFMSIRLTRKGLKPSAAMDTDGNLKAEWRQLFISFPDRFVIGGESMYGSAQSGRFDEEFVLYQKMLSQLPRSVARQIASSNAQAIYRLKPNP